jgi:transposase
MKTRLVNVDRDTPLLLPPDLRDWVPEDDMVHFVLEAVAGMPLTTLKFNRRGSGSAQYPPKMMLALLIYCYANGIFSSRRIERATYRDVAVRYLTGDTHPDHDTICKFRREHFEAVAQAFLEVLKLARQMGVLKVGTVSVDGTHIAASASRDRNVRYDRAGELDRQLQQDIAELMRQAEQADQRDTEDGQRMPDEIKRRQKLQEKMQQARAALEAQAKARAQAEREAYERKLAEHDQRPPGRQGPRPQPPAADADQPRPAEQINLTDADSKLMRKSKRSAYTQSYNAQASVDAQGSMLILSGHVTSSASDAHELIPSVRAVPAEVGCVTTVLADSGYVDTHDIEQLQQDGVDVYVAVSREENHDQRRYDFRPPPVDSASGGKRVKVVTHPTLVAMKQKLQTPEGKRLYAQRKQTVEPVFGIIKSVLGFRQFLLRGLEKVNGEWSLVRLAYNLKRLWTLQAAG